MTSSARAVPEDRRGDPGGLSTREATLRRARYGPNDVLEPARHAWWALVADTARDPMLWFLVVTSALYASIGERLESLTLAAAVLPLALMDAYLHRRTAASTAGLQSRLAARARVVRDGVEREVAAVELVPGDVVVLVAGDAIPADGVVVAASEVQVDETTLTGESDAVRKRAVAVPLAGPALPIAGTHWMYAGTRMLAGRARLAVAFTGGETLYWELARAAAAGGSAPTPLQRAIGRLVLVLTATAVAACVALAGVRVAQGHGVVDALVSALTLAVAALPEELPVVFTFFLGVGVHRLARRHALVRRAVAVENVGRVTTICSDKTGTLTEGRLVLTHLVPAPGHDDAGLAVLARLAARGESGDPVDVAIAATAGRARAESGQAMGLADDPAVERVATFPFTEERKRETTILRRRDGSLFAIMKGAPEVVLAATTLDAAARGEWSERAAALAREGHKVLACAAGPIAVAAQHANAGASESARESDATLALAGLLAFEDPLRPGVADAVRGCAAAGLRVVMVTGDHPLTAVAVARAIGLGGAEPRVCVGDDVVAALADAGTAGPVLRDVDVVARATPSQKLALVEAFERAGEIVAVTGDGVNDVPALTRADVGIAMGARGTQSAREVAPIVLLDDDFATIVGAIAEGRQLFRNLQRSIRYLLMIHIPLVTTAALIPLAGYPLLYLPIHIVWLELVMHPTALLAFQDSARPAALARSTRPAGAAFFDGGEWLGIVVVGMTLAMFVAGGFLGALAEGSPVEHARAVALVTLSFASAAVAAVLTGLATASARAITAATVAGVLVAVQTPGLAGRLHVSPLHGDDLGGAAVAALVVAGLAWLFGRRPRRRAETAVRTGVGRRSSLGDCRRPDEIGR